MSTESATSPSLKADLKRMAPIAILVVFTAVVVVLAMKYISLNFLERAIVASKSSCSHADLYVAAGRMKLEKIRVDGAAIRLESSSLAEPSLGSLKGNQRLDEARADFEKALRLCAIREEAHDFLSVVEWYRGDAAQSYYHQGMVDRMNQNYGPALVNFKLGLESEEEHLPSLIGLAKTYADLNQLDHALEVTDAHLDVMKTTGEGEIALGQVYLAARKLDDAKEYLREGLLKEPSNIPAMKDLARIYDIQKNNYRDAAEFFLSLGDDGRNTVGDAYHLASIYFLKADDLRGQEKALRRTIEYFPNYASFRFDLATNLHKQQKYNEAADILRQAIDRDSRYVMERIKETGVKPGTEQ